MKKILRNEFEIINVMACSVDGKIAFHSHESSAERRAHKFVCEEDFQRMQSTVASCDAVFVGARTLESEMGAFRVAHLRYNLSEPLWIVFSRSGNISLNHPFWQQANIPKSIFFVSSFDYSENPMLTIQENELNIVTYLGNISGLISKLSTMGLTKFVLLGGGELNAAFWEQNLVTELKLTISPFVVGKKDSPSLISSSFLLQKKLQCQNVSSSGDFVFIDYKIKEI